MRRVQRLLGGQQPSELTDYLFVPDPAKAYLAGSSVQSLAMRYRKLPSGLLVPAAASVESAPTDFMRTYLTADELTGRPFGIRQAADWLGVAHRDTVLIVVAGLLGEREGIGADWPSLDRAMAERVFPEPLRSKVLGLLGKDRALVAPQGLLVAAKIALLASPEDGNEDLVMFVPAVLAIQKDLTSHGLDADDKISPGGRLFREIVRSQAFHSETAERSHLTTFQSRWRELPAQMPEPRVDLVAAFGDATGVPLDDFSAVGTALWARSLQRPGQPVPADYFSTYDWEPDRLERALRLISREPADLAELLAKDDEELGFQWSFDRLRQFPVVRLAGGHLVLSPRLLFERVFGWLPIFDLVQGWIDAGQEDRGRDALGFFRRVCERLALDSLRAIAGNGPAKRLYDDEDLRGAFGRRRKVVDAVFDAASAWVVVEVSTRQLMRGARGGDSEADLSADLERGVYEKVAQLDATIRALQEDERRLTGSPSLPGRRFIPLLVATEGFPVNPMTTAAIERELAVRRLLEGPLVAPLRIVDQEELDMIESIVETGQASFLAILEGWERAALRWMDLKTWLLSGRFDVRSPRRKDNAFRRSWEPALRALRVTIDEANGGAGA